MEIDCTSLPTLSTTRSKTLVKKAQSPIDGGFAEIERAIEITLNYYSNVHRGTGHASMISTILFEHARKLILEQLGLDEQRYEVIFCTPHRAKALIALLPCNRYQLLSSQDLGLPLGIRALVVRKKDLPRGVPFQTGGGVVRLVSPNSVVWAYMPDRFEAGTPPIVNVIAFAKALQITHMSGENAFKTRDAPLSPSEILDQDTLSELSGKALFNALRDTLIGQNLLVPTTDGLRAYVNLDNGASTPTFAPIWKTVCRTWRQPETTHQALIREVRERCATFLDAPTETYEIFFTSNATEALNLAAQGCTLSDKDEVEPVILNTLMEHHSNELPWRYKSGISLARLPADDEGFIDLQQLEEFLRAYNKDHRYGRKRVRLVAVSGASNVLGSFNDLHEISRITHLYGAQLLVDGAQLFAHRKVSLQANAIDYFAFSGHKAYAPFGSGGLVARKGLLCFTPEEEAQIQASGEENVTGIAALGKAITLLQNIGMDIVETEERALTRYALQSLSTVPGIQLYGIQDPDSLRLDRRGGVLTFRLQNTPHNLTAQLLAEHGAVGVRNGCFCAHLITKQLMHIHPLRSFAAEIGLYIVPEFTSTILPGVVRASIGLENDRHDIDQLVQTLQRIAREPRTFMDRLAASTRNGTPCPPHTAVGKAMQALAQSAVHLVYNTKEFRS